MAKRTSRSTITSDKFVDASTILSDETIDIFEILRISATWGRGMRLAKVPIAKRT